jgi:hypothetical protein
MFPPNCTLTTGCFCLTKYNGKSRNNEESIENMRALLEVPCYLDIYTDEVLFPFISKVRNAIPGFEKLTRYNIVDVETLETFKHLGTVHSNREKYHPTKDERTCPESHLVCCSKFELVLRTMRENPFGTEKFGWIDSNIGRNFSKIASNYKNNMLLKILNETTPERFHLQILNVNEKKFISEEHWREYYTRYRWVVCGCLFICGKEVGTEILNDLISVFEKHTLAGYGHAEEMFYLEILDKHFDKIERSYGDYQHILNNFVGIETGLHYILNLATSYMNLGYHREAQDCCDKVLSQFENFKIEADYHLYFKFLFIKYVTLFYFNRDDAKKLVKEKIFKLIETNPHFNREYNNGKEFYDLQFKFAM